MSVASLNFLSAFPKRFFAESALPPASSFFASSERSQALVYAFCASARPAVAAAVESALLPNPDVEASDGVSRGGGGGALPAAWAADGSEAAAKRMLARTA